MRILLLSAYDTDSHKAWCQGLMEHCPQFDWQYLTLPGRYFSWRIRGNALSWAYGESRSVLMQHYDLVLATSMVDLATLKGLIPNLANTPCVIYFHENQFAYPSSTQQHASIEPQMVNLYSALAADYVLFNSHYNRQTLLGGAERLLKKMPDFAPLEAIEKIRQQSSVLPVPIQPANIPSDKITPSQTLKVIWNHRWEYDKGPEVLQQVIRLSEKRGLDIQFTIAGRRFRSIPEPFKDLQSQPANCVIHMDTFEDKAQYLSALSQHHVVLSTAHHEFQGLAMLEGATYGCTPLAPNDLAYPEWIPPDCLYQTHNNAEAQANIILNHLSQWQTGSIPATPNTQPYIWPELAKQYSEKLLKIKEEYSV